MEEVLDALRRIISRWVETTAPILSDVNIGDTVLNIYSTKRFQVGDEVMIQNATEGEPGLIVQSIIDDTHILLSTPVANFWPATTSSDNILLRKLVNGMFVEGIYIGEPDVIPTYPAITVNGTTVNSEWMTLGATKETYEVEIAVYVEQSTQEEGYRFMTQIAKVITEGLKKNVFPLINDYETTAVTASILKGDEYIKVADSSIFDTPQLTVGSYPQLSDARIIIEDQWKSMESRVQYIIDATTIQILPLSCEDFDVTISNPIAIRPNRFFYNSWPSTVNLGKTSKSGTLLQAAVINWHGDECQPQNFRNLDPNLS